MWLQDEHLHSHDAPYITAWELYAQSVFCLQPPGDSPTRRAFYDSLLFGCIPVISKSAAESYTYLFGRQVNSSCCPLRPRTTPFPEENPY